MTCLEINPEMAAAAKSNIEKVGMANRVEIIVGDAKKSALELRGSIDLLLIDARKDEYLRYLQATERLLHLGSVVVADNAKVFATEVTDYLDYVKGSGKYESKTVEAPLASDHTATDAMEISVKL